MKARHRIAGLEFAALDPVDNRQEADAQAAQFGNGTASFTVNASSAPAPTPTPAPAAGNSLVLHVSGDSGHGDPQFVVKLDGQQIGGVQTATASHDAGQSQDIALNLGAVDATKAHDLSISFVNDGFGGSHATDTNLYVGGVTLDGQHVDGGAFTSNNASLGYDSSDPHAAVMVSRFSVGAASLSAPATATVAYDRGGHGEPEPGDDHGGR